MIQLRVNDIDVPPAERTFADRLQDGLGPEYEVLITVQESEWFPRGAVEHIQLFIHHHEAAIGTAIGYTAKTAVDLFNAWAKERLTRAPHNTEVLTIVGPDNRPVRKVIIKKDSTQEE